MESNQKIKNRLGSIYISLISLLAILGFFFNGLVVMDIVDILLVLALFILLQKEILNLKNLCILSIFVGAIVLVSCKGITVIMSIWLIIYSIISLITIKNDIDI